MTLNKKNLRELGNLFNGISFNQSIDEDYYKPIRTKSTFHGNYIEHESKGDKNKKWSLNEYLDMIFKWYNKWS